MRNLKRALSLTLASVMLLGMMVVGSSAASYPDVDDTHNVEAIDVLQTIKVMVGDDNGNFGPDDPVNRAQMAVVMALLLDLDHDYYKGTNPFWDVPSWAEPYVAACYANGIVSGYNATTYGAGDPVTAVQAASMMMRALGYFQYQSDYKDGFELSTVKQASKISLFKDVNASGNNAALTRNQVAQLALNTLEATIVDAKDNTLSINTGANAGNISITGGQVDYIVRTSDQDFAKAIYDNQEKNSDSTSGIKGWTVELGEQLFNGDLKKDTFKYHQGAVAEDIFQRPATRWTYKFNEIGTYADTPDYSYTKAASGNTAADKVKDMGLKGYKWDGSYIENGNPVVAEDDKGNALTSSAPNYENSAAALEFLADKVAADGVLIEVFMDDDKTDTIERVTVIRTQMMQVSSVNSKEVTLKILDDDSRDHEGASPIPMGKHSGFHTVDVVKEDDAGFDVLKDLKDDDYVLIVPVTENNGVTYTVASAVVPETVEGAITNIYTKSGDTKIKAISVDNERYNMSYAWTAENDELRNDTTLSTKQDSTVYLDTYGYAIYVTDVKATNSVIIVDEIFQSLVSGKVVTYVDGWDTNGEEVTLNLGTAANLKGFTAETIQGTVWEYKSTTANNADYELVDRANAINTVKDKNGNDVRVGNALVFAPDDQKQWIKNGQFDADVIPAESAKFEDGTKLPMATNVKFIFLSIDSVEGRDVTGITVRDGVTAVGEDKNGNGVYDTPANPDKPLPTEDKVESISYVLNKDKNKVIAVVVADDADAAVTENLIFVKENNEHWTDSNDSGKTKTAFVAYDAQGNLLDNGRSLLNKNEVDHTLNKRFFTFSKNADDVYSLNEYIRTDRTTSVSSQGSGKQAIQNIYAIDDNGYFIGVTGEKLNALNATVIDLDTGDKVITNTAKQMSQAIKDKKATGFEIAYIYNGSDNTGRNTVSTLFVLDTLTTGGSEPEPGSFTVTVTVDDVKVGEKTGKADETYSIEVTVPEGKTIDYSGKTYKAGEKFNVTGTITKTETIALVTKDAEKAAIDDFIKSITVKFGDDELEVTAAHVLTASDVAAASGSTPAGPYNGCGSAGDLYIEFAKPTDGTTLSTTVTGTVRSSKTDFGSTFTSMAAGRGNTYSTKIATSGLAAVLPKMKAEGVNINLEVTAAGYPVNVVLPDGYYQTAAASENDATIALAGADLKFAFTGVKTVLGDGIKSVDVKLEITGVKGGKIVKTVTKTVEADGNTVKLTNINGGSMIPTGAVEVKVTEVKAKTVGYKAVDGAKHTITTTLSATPTVGTSAALPTLNIKAGSNSSPVNVVNGTKAKITFTVSGIEGGPTDYTTKWLTAGTNEYTINAAAYGTGAIPEVKPDGSGTVTITIKSVEYFSVKATFTAAITTPGTAGDKVKGGSLGTTAASAVDVEVTDGKFIVTLTLSDTAGSGAAADGLYKVTCTGITDPLIENVTIDATHQNITFEVTADDTITYDFVVTRTGNLPSNP